MIEVFKHFNAYDKEATSKTNEKTQFPIVRTHSQGRIDGTTSKQLLLPNATIVERTASESCKCDIYRRIQKSDRRPLGERIIRIRRVNTGSIHRGCCSACELFYDNYYYVSIATLTYGLELCNLTVSLENKLDTATR